MKVRIVVKLITKKNIFYVWLNYSDKNSWTKSLLSKNALMIFNLPNGSLKVLKVMLEFKYSCKR